MVSTLIKALQTTETETRSYELLNGIVSVNPIRGDGKEADETIKRLLSKGENPKEKDLTEFKKIVVLDYIGEKSLQIVV